MSNKETNDTLIEDICAEMKKEHTATAPRKENQCGEEQTSESSSGTEFKEAQIVCCSLCEIAQAGISQQHQRRKIQSSVAVRFLVVRKM